MALAALAQNEFEAAGKYIGDIMSYLKSDSLGGMWEPLRTYRPS